MISLPPIQLRHTLLILTIANAQGFTNAQPLTAGHVPLAKRAEKEDEGTDAFAYLIYALVGCESSSAVCAIFAAVQIAI